MFDSPPAGFDASRRMTADFWNSAASARAAGVTIALRLPILMQAAWDPFAWPARREAARAGMEKWEAGVEGAIGAWFAASTMWATLMLRPGDAQAAAHGLATIARAATRPARVRVRSNARRLAGR